MFPLEEGVWGKPLTRPPAPTCPLRRLGGSPILRLGPQDLSCCAWWVALCERFRFGGVGRIASTSILTRSLPLVSPCGLAFGQSPPRRPAPPVVVFVRGRFAVSTS